MSTPEAPQGVPAGVPAVMPYLFYEDVAGALAWLARAFGLSLEFSMPGPGGSIMHAELRTPAGGIVMLGPPHDDNATASPRHLPAVNQSLYVYVADVDAHFAQAKGAGATLLSEPTEMFWGDKLYTARDLEGHRWTFAQHVRDVPHDELKPPGA